MKKIIILPFLFLALISWGQAQFVVQNGTKTEVYSNINTAITNAVAGDTLYLPGGGFTITTKTIDKTLHWVGHGHYPSETGATMQTRITSGLTFTGNSDNSSFEGILFTSYLNFGSSDDEVVNIKMKRCRVMNTVTFRNVETGNPNLNFQISECVLQSIDAKYGSNCLVEKSLIFSYIDKFYQSNFNHNSINVNGSSSYGNSSIRWASGCTFTNNVFGLRGGLYNSESNNLYNNVFAEGIPYGGTSSNGGANNIYNVGDAAAYTTINGNVYTFEYDNDYHLSSVTGTAESDGATVSILLSANDGTNPGIYGSPTPYKTIPYYPHINTAVIATKATNDQLGVDVNAQAQSR
ncbi:hypothetical protein [Draconibacterium halophilum]|uniref:Pectate lyase superfamily protein domain-containing protein n=1 Tax=Draconibacterium halophilum TaxID=2706887 RepID=A0A6C0RA63_9BACT|nr:hypothetical protein [Draconibacterium halophilum]QIA06323.1 hypothetical protein G0Q07_00605 [Draconibacterium halophilum]